MDSGGLEATYIRESHSALMDHIARGKYPFGLGIVGTVIACMGAGIAVATVIAIADAVGAPAFGEPPGGRNWQLRVVGDFGLLLIGIVAMMSALKYVALFSPMLASYLGKWLTMASFDETDTYEVQIERARFRIEAAVREGTLGPGRRFNPAVFLQQNFVGDRHVWLIATIILMLMDLSLFYYAAHF